MLDFDMYMCAIDAVYFETREHNMEMAKKAIQLIDEYMEHPNADKPNYYAHLARLYKMVGDYDKASCYRQLMEEVEWESQHTYIIASSWVDVWNMWCDHEYEKITQYVKQNRECLLNIIVSAIYSYVKEI